MTAPRGQVNVVPGQALDPEPARHAAQAQPASDAAEPDVRRHHAQGAVLAGQLQLPDPRDAPPVHVDHLMVEHVPAQPQLVGGVSRAFADVGVRSDGDLASLEGVHRFPGDAPGAVADLGNDRRHAREALVQAHRQIAHAPDPGTVRSDQVLAEVVGESEQGGGGGLAGRGLGQPGAPSAGTVQLALGEGSL